jgi:beta-fructofuranosidase
MVLGSGIAHHGGAILLYRSRDLVSWEFVKTFAERQPDPYSAFDPWEVWECPDFFSLGDRHVLIFSAAGKAYWQSGRFDEAALTFYPERSGFLDYGNYYAPKTQLDAEGNRILWGWVPETRPESETRAAGWAGMMSLPRVLALNRDGDLIQTYLPGLRHLRGTGQTFEAGLPKKISLPDCAAEVEIRIPRGERDYTIEIAEGENQAWLPIAYRAASPELIWIEGRPLKAFAAGADIQIIRIFIDGSVIEVSVNDKVMLTRRFYYAGRRRDAVLRLSSPAENGMELRLWPMTAA